MKKNKYYCRIDGTIYNLKSIQEMIDSEERTGPIYISLLEDYKLPEKYADRLTYYIYEKNSIPADLDVAWDEIRDRNSQDNQNNQNSQSNRNAKNLESRKKPHCPKCGSASITVATRGSTLLYGIWGSNDPVNYCISCGYKWEPR